MISVPFDGRAADWPEDNFEKRFGTPSYSNLSRPNVCGATDSLSGKLQP